MLEIVPFREQVGKEIGLIQNVTLIEKGFSCERKFKISAGRQDYLIRLSSIDFCRSKSHEFELMRTLYEDGVRCNKPIILFGNEEQNTLCAVYSYLPGVDAEDNMTGRSEEFQYNAGVEAGRDLRRINSLSCATNDWKARKWKKHEHFIERYLAQDYRFTHDGKVLRFIELHYDTTEADRDRLQHDDFHLANILIDEHGYSGVIDFNRLDWGDPLHEFVKLEWFTWPVSPAFARGQMAGYFKRSLDDAECLQIAVYIAMSILSTIVWTLEFHPDTWNNIEGKTKSILEHFDYFERIRPKWAP